MKKFILMLQLLLLLATIAEAQTVSVRDAISGQGLEFATISSHATNFSALTDSRGKAEVSRLENTDSIYFNTIGYEMRLLSWEQLRAMNFIVALQPLDYNLDEVIVSATRWAQPRRDLTQKVSSIRADEISLANPQTAADLLSASGEVFIQKSQQGGGSPMIRGFATNRLLISVDGVRMNNAIFRSGNLQNIISIDPFSVQSAEVLFGPGSVIYGSDAIGGVMNFSTLQPKFSTDDQVLVQGNAIARFSSANSELTEHFDVGIGGRKWASVTSFSFNKFGDLRMGSKGPAEYLRNEYVQRVDSVDQVVTNTDPLVQTPSGYQMTSLLQKFRFKPNERWDFEYGFNYSATSDYARYDRLLRYRNGLPRSAEWYYGPQIWMMNNLRITHRSDAVLFDEMIVNAAVQHFEESRHDRDFNKSTLAERFEKVEAYSLNLDFAKELSESSKLLYGAEVVSNQVVSTGVDRNVKTGVGVAGPARYPASSWLSAAAFATFQHRFSESTLMQAGIRYNYFSLQADFDTTFYPFPFKEVSLDNSALTGSIGINYHPDESWVVRANLSSGFRSPNVDDLGKVFDSEPGAVVVPNPALKPEYAYNAEFDVAKVFAHRLKLDVSAYYTYLDNAMVRRDFTLNGRDSIVYDGEMSRVQAIQNAAKATVYGVQASAEWKMGGGFSLYSLLTWQKGEEELDDGSMSPLRHAAPLFGMSRLRFDAPHLRIDLYTNYSSKVPFADMPEEEKGKDYMYAIDADGNPFSPGWYTLNLKAMVFVTDDLDISAGVENLTDQRYRPYSSGLVAAGRNVIFSARFKF